MRPSCYSRAENAYYNSKGLRESDLREAAESFEQVIKQEQEALQQEGASKKYGQWSYKSMKQLVKIPSTSFKRLSMYPQRTFRSFTTFSAQSPANDPAKQISFLSFANRKG